MRTYRNFGIWDFNIPKNGVHTTNVDALVPVGTVSSTAMVWTEWTDYSYTPFYPSYAPEIRIFFWILMVISSEIQQCYLFSVMVVT